MRWVFKTLQIQKAALRCQLKNLPLFTFMVLQQKRFRDTWQSFLKKEDTHAHKSLRLQDLRRMYTSENMVHSSRQQFSSLLLLLTSPYKAAFDVSVKKVFLCISKMQQKCCMYILRTQEHKATTTGKPVSSVISSDTSATQVECAQVVKH